MLTKTREKSSLKSTLLFENCFIHKINGFFLTKMRFCKIATFVQNNLHIYI